MGASSYSAFKALASSENASPLLRLEPKEHCQIHLKQLPTTGLQVDCCTRESVCVVDIGDGIQDGKPYHPLYIEP